MIHLANVSTKQRFAREGPMNVFGMDLDTRIKSAINSAIRQGVLGYEGSEIWRKG